MFRFTGIGPRLAIAFATMAGVTCLVVLAGLASSREVMREIHSAQTVRLPASLTAEQAQGYLMNMQLGVRGYLVLGDPSDIAKYAQARLAFETNLATLQSLAATWNEADASDVRRLSDIYARWEKLPRRLFELHDNPLVNQPALRVARVKLQPLRVEIKKQLDALLYEQRGQVESPSSRVLLSDIVAYQASFDSFTTDLLAYASSGELNFRLAYGPKLSTNAALWLALLSQRGKMTGHQRLNLDRIDQARKEIIDLALEITSQVNGERAYEDRYLYRTEVEPQAESMMRILAALTKHQRELLQTEVDSIDQRLVASRVVALIGSAVAVLLAFLLAAIAIRRIVGPMRSLTAVAEELAAGEQLMLPPEQARDEIALLAETIRTRLRKGDLQRILASVSDAIWSADVDAEGELHYRYFSPVIERISGSPASCFLEEPRNWLSIVHPDDRDALVRRLRAIATGGSSSEDIEYRILRPDRTIRWLRDSVRAARSSDGRVLVDGVISDITDRRRFEDDLRRRQEVLDLAQRVARAAAFDLDITPGQAQRWPTVLEVLHGLAPGTFDGTKDGWKRLVYPDDWDGVRQALRRARTTGELAYEYRVVHADGAVRWLQAKGKFFFGQDNVPIRMVGFMLDVTERHEAETELQRLESQLRQAQRLEAMGTLAGGIAHDFNNILGAILGYGEMASRDLLPGSRIKRDVDSIMAAGERGRALVERILAFSRSAVGERVAVHVQNVVREAIELINAQAPKSIVVESTLNGGNAATIGDPTQVHQVLMNLAANAIQAMPGSGRLKIRLDLVRLETPRRLTTGTLSAGAYIALSVSDTGCGIQPEILDRIFDPFFTTKEVGVGTGLGLSLVHGTVTQIRGAVDVRTAPGAGSEFVAYLPHSGFASEQSKADEPELPTGLGQRVFVVDDEPALAELVGENLTELGYCVDVFSSSTAALRTIRAKPTDIDLLVTDERMPDMSGLRLVEEVKRIRPEVPIIVVSGNLSPELAVRLREAGVNGFLGKPILCFELAQMLARVLREEARTAQPDSA